MVLTPERLEVLTQSLTAVLGVWLGLTVLTRVRTPTARVFALLSLTLAVWSASIIVQRLSTNVQASEIAHAVEELATALIVPAMAHLSLVISTEGHPSRRQGWIILVAYGLNLLWALPGVIDPNAPIAIEPPHLAVGPLSGELLGWARLATRLITLAIGAWWLFAAYRRTRPNDPRRKQLAVTGVAVAVGTLGGVIRLLSEITQTDPWIGLSLVSLGMVIAASVVFSPGFFFPPDVAGKAFWTSLTMGLTLFLLIAILLAVDAVTRRFLGIDLPLPTILVLVVTVAVYEPVVGWIRARIGGRTAGEIARERLLAAIGQPTLTAQAADAGVQPALTRMTQALGLMGAVVVRRDGTIAAAEGAAPDPSTSQAIALVAQGEVIGELRVAATQSGAPLGGSDAALMHSTAEYLAAALRTGRREDEQAAALSGLTVERAQVDSSGSSLYEALVRRATVSPGLQVFALGPLRVVHGGSPIQRWGGEKAGTRQAQGLFAFLLDRGERGVAKDEALELIWPDIDVDKADLAFHRTLGGLRHTIDPDAAGGKRAIRFHNDRYRLDPSVVDWSDVDAFLGKLDEARRETTAPVRLRRLEEARALYRGDYLDDCPFYGDGVHVEERRASLRGRAIDLLIALGEGYEALGDRASAAAAFREATTVAEGDCPPAEAGLARLSAST